MEVIFYMILTAGAVIFLYWVFPWLVGRVYRIRLKGFCRQRGEIVLSFDDGPGRRLTPQVLDLLEQNGIRANFFLLGRNIAGREDLVERIQRGGHEICSHSFNHLHAWKAAPWRIIQDINRGMEAIRQALQVDKKVYPFRPPHGKLNLVSLLYLWTHKIPICYWTLDSGDTWPVQQREECMSRVEQLKQGGVILLHDFDRQAETANQTDHYVLDSVQCCLAISHSSDLKISTFSDAASTRDK